MDSTSTSTALTVSRGDPIGDLYLLRISPFSRRVLLSLRHTRACVSVKEYRAFFSEFIIWVRLGCPKDIAITAPALFRPGHSGLLDSHAIARILDANRAPGVPTLFPAEHDNAIRRLVAHAETLAIYGRAQLTEFLKKRPDVAARLFLPNWVKGLFFAPAIANMMIPHFDKKFRPLAIIETEAKARVACDEITEAVKEAKKVDGVRYLVGDSLTYADFTMSMSIFWADDPHSHFASIKNDLPWHPFTEEYPEIREWAEDFRKKYVTAESVSFPPPQYGKDGRIM